MRFSYFLAACAFIVITPCFQEVKCQTQENFEQTPWPSDTTWAGDTSHFRTNSNQQLQLDAPDQTGFSQITTSRNPTNAPLEWELWGRMDFSPSSNNKLRIYLSSDTADLNGPLNGYFLEIGENGSDDGIDLYRQDGNSDQALIQSKDGIVAKNDNRFRIQVNRDTAGTWTLRLDTLGGQKFVKAGTATDTTYPVQPYFGLWCDYTSTRSDRFYFDDLYAGPPRIDTIPPNITEARVLRPDSLKVTFSETLQAGKAQKTELYRVNKGIGKAQSANRLSQAPNEVVLTFDTSFANKTRYQLWVDSATDLAGNIKAETDTGHFAFFKAKAGHLLINELIPDPTPSKGLPEAEFIELYNATGFPVQLTNWQISDQSFTETLPNLTLPPDSFAILCNQSDEAKFSPYGMVVPLGSLPSLNNGGDRIIIQNANGDVIDKIAYDDTWFEKPGKADGGWSLERVNLIHPCSDGRNWKGSENSDGGTPGKRNSVDSAWVDSVAPKVKKVEPQDSLTIQLRFNEPLDTTKVDTQQFNIANGPQVETIKVPNETKLILKLRQPLTPNDTHKLTVSGIRDCWGNRVNPPRAVNFPFIRPQEAQYHDIVFNELMLVPEPVQNLPSHEYIELYNRSEKLISLQNWTLADPVSQTDLPDTLLFPSDYAIVPSSTHQEAFAEFGKVVPVAGLPNLNNNGDALSLKNADSILIDSLTYQSSWFDSSNKAEGGWALEQINPDHPCSNGDNWQGSTVADGGTPGSRNSVFNDQPDEQAPEVTSIEVIDTSRIRITFSERVDSISISTADWEFSPEQTVKKSFASSPLTREATLHLADQLQANTTYQLQYQGIRDCWGNEVDREDTLSFEHLVPKKARQNDLVIHEIMANPEPSVGLPPHEYLEIKNISDKILNLKGWEIRHNTGTTTLPKHNLKPDSFQIICNQFIADSFKNYGPVLGVSGFPRLNVTGERLTLTNDDGQTIFTIAYDRSWYQDDLKAEGGWSLAMMDTKAPCAKAGNWSGSENNMGGTPGQPNSVAQYQPDQTPPELERVAMQDSSTLILFLNEKLDSALTTAKTKISITPEGPVIPIKIAPQPPDFTKALVHFEEALDPTERYKIEIDSLADCSGNVQTETQQATFGIPKSPDSFSLVINEILVNPHPNGADYVELYNHSSRPVDLQELYWATLDDRYELKDPVALSLEPLQLLPKSYMAFTTDVKHISNKYLVKKPDHLYELASLPTWPNDAGHVLLVNDKGQKMDRVDYNADWHMDMLNNEEGVSLERIAFEGASNKPVNWHSAAAEAGFGTPTYENSQHGKPRETKEPVEVNPKSFSPDQDGYKDFVNIRYDLDKPGYMANVEVYDAKGREVTTLVHNQSVGKYGKWKWDGAKSGGNKAAIGSYILFIEFFHPQDGDKQVYKKAVTLSP